MRDLLRVFSVLVIGVGVAWTLTALAQCPDVASVAGVDSDGPEHDAEPALSASGSRPDSCSHLRSSLVLPVPSTTTPGKLAPEEEMAVLSRLQNARQSFCRSNRSQAETKAKTGNLQDILAYLRVEEFDQMFEIAELLLSKREYLAKCDGGKAAPTGPGYQPFILPRFQCADGWVGDIVFLIYINDHPDLRYLRALILDIEHRLRGRVAGGK